MAVLVYRSSHGDATVRIPHTIHRATGQMVLSMKALQRAAYRAGKRTRRFRQCYEQNGPALKVVASQRRRRGK